MTAPTKSDQKPVDGQDDGPRAHLWKVFRSAMLSAGRDPYTGEPLPDRENDCND